MGTFVVPSLDGDSDAGRGDPILLGFELKRVKKYKVYGILYKK